MIPPVLTTPDDIAFRVGSLLGRPAIATDRLNLVVTTNAHWDHPGAHEAFDSIAVHEAEHEWVSEGINGLDVDDVRDCLRKDAIRPLPEDFDPDDYQVLTTAAEPTSSTGSRSCCEVVGGDPYRSRSVAVTTSTPMARASSSRSNRGVWWPSGLLAPTPT